MISRTSSTTIVYKRETLEQQCIFLVAANNFSWQKYYNGLLTLLCQRWCQRLAIMSKKKAWKKRVQVDYTEK